MYGHEMVEKLRTCGKLNIKYDERFKDSEYTVELTRTRVAQVGESSCDVSRLKCQELQMRS